MKVPKIIEAKAIKMHVLRVKFDNGDVRDYDISLLLSREPFSDLKNKVLFKSVQVELGGHAIVWNDRIDLSEYEVWKNGVEPI